MKEAKVFMTGIAIVFALSIIFVSPCVAQVTTGDITGRVTDAQGRVVSGATVSATNKEIGRAHV